MSTHSINPLSRSASPDHNASPEEKRASKKRKVLSCYTCRNRKMKCDRIFPVCGRCASTGRADTCSYDPRMVEEFHSGRHEDTTMNRAGVSTTPGIQHNSTFLTTHGAPNSDSVAWKMQSQQRRIEMLEKKLASLDTRSDAYATPGTGFSHDDNTGNAPNPPKEWMMFRGKNFKTQFYGSTSPMALFVQFPELHIFTKQTMYKDSGMARIKSDFKTFRSRRKASKTRKNNQIANLSDTELLALIPEKQVVDNYVSLYFENFENTHRVLHILSFWRDYEAFWTSPKTTEPSFHVTLLLVMASARCLSDNEETAFVGDSSSGREEASRWTEAAESWLARQSRKHLTLAFFQVQCLLCIARRVNGIKMKQDWVHTGELIRCGMSSGMHRDPSYLSSTKTTEFNKEMRRRIWATMVELELDSSLEKGIQSAITTLDFDCPAPANIEDDLFGPDSLSAPLSRSIDGYTRTSFLNVSRNSLPLRLHLTSLLNTPKAGLQYEDILHYDAKLNTALTSLPSWSQPHTRVASILLDHQLRQYLLILHQPFAKLAASNPRYAYSTTASLSTASKILGDYTALAAGGSHILNLFRNDLFRASLSLSQAIYSISPPIYLICPVPQHTPADIGGPENPLKYATHTPVSPLPLRGASTSVFPPFLPSHRLVDVAHDHRSSNTTTPSSNPFLPALTTFSAPLLESALSTFETKILRLGTGYMEYWIMAAAAGLAAAPTGPGPNVTTGLTEAGEVRCRGQMAIERVMRLCHKVLALQPAVGVERDLAGEPGVGVGGGDGGLGGCGVGVGIDGVTTTAQGADGMLDMGLGVQALEDMDITSIDSFGSVGAGLDWAWTEFWDFDMGDL